MGLIYLPTFTIQNQPNIGKHTIHGWYGSCFWVEVSTFLLSFFWSYIEFLGGQKLISKAGLDVEKAKPQCGENQWKSGEAPVEGKVLLMEENLHHLRCMKPCR